VGAGLRAWCGAVAGTGPPPQQQQQQQTESYAVPVQRVEFETS